MGYSRLEYPYSGGSQNFAVDFALDFINRSDVTVYVQGEKDGLGQPIPRAFTWIDDDNINVTAALPNPCVVVLDRTVDKDQLVLDVSGTAAFTRATLVTGFKQLMMGFHELLDGRVDEFNDIIEIRTLVGDAQTANAQATADITAAQTLLDDATTDLAGVQAAQTSADASATTATTGANTATTKASEASASAATATTKASEASASAATATTKAAEASTSASTATTKASEASTSATGAANSAASITGAEATCTTKASEASASATASEASAVRAEDAATTVENKQNALASVSSFELGSGLTGDRSAFMDLHASDAVDFSARIVREPGVNGRLKLEQTGTGSIYLNAGVDMEGPVRLLSGAPTFRFIDADFARAGSNHFRITANGGLFRIDTIDSAETYHQAAYQINTDTTGPIAHAFYIGASVLQARVDTSGLKVGTVNDTPGGGNNEVGCSIRADGRVWFGTNGTPALHLGRNNDGELQQFNRATNKVGNISVTGSGTTYATTSDYRVKENLEPITGASDIISFLNPTFFTFKETGEWMDGFIAHEVQAVIPGAVTGEQDAMRDEEYEISPAEYDAEGNETKAAVMGVRSVPDYQGIDHSRIVPYVVKALQEQMGRVDALWAADNAKDAIIADLLARVEALENPTP